MQFSIRFNPKVQTSAVFKFDFSDVQWRSFDNRHHFIVCIIFLPSASFLKALFSLEISGKHQVSSNYWNLLKDCITRHVRLIMRLFVDMLPAFVFCYQEKCKRKLHQTIPTEIDRATMVEFSTLRIEIILIVMNTCIYIYMYCESLLKC